MLTREQFERQRERMQRLMSDFSGRHLTRPQMRKANTIAEQALQSLSGSSYGVHHEVIAILLADASKDVIRQALLDAEDEGRLSISAAEARIAGEAIDALIGYVRNRASRLLNDHSD